MCYIILSRRFMYIIMYVLSTQSHYWLLLISYYYYP